MIASEMITELCKKQNTSPTELFRRIGQTTEF